jgi:hypothetical protein
MKVIFSVQFAGGCGVGLHRIRGLKGLLTKRRIILKKGDS